MRIKSQHTPTSVGDSLQDFQDEVNSMLKSIKIASTKSRMKKKSYMPVIKGNPTQPVQEIQAS